MENSDTPEERLTDIRNDDQSAIEELWQRYGAKIQQVASKYLGSAPRRIMDSEDIKHVAFMSLVGFIKDFDPEATAVHQGFTYEELKDGIWPVAFGIAKRKALMANRSAKASKRGGDLNQIQLEKQQTMDRSREEPWVIASLEEQLQFLKNYAGESQSAHLVKILQLRSEGVSSKQIAAELDLSESAVSRRLKELRKALEEFGESSS